MYWLLLRCCLIGALLGSQPAWAIDLCQVLKQNSGITRDDPTLLKELWERVKSIFTPVPSATALPSQKPPAPLALSFTTASGFSIKPICDDGHHWEASLYYPIGLVVKPLAEGDLGGKLYTLVETEYGLHLFLLKEHLSPLTPQATYVFANSAERKGYCSAPTDCIEPTQKQQIQTGRHFSAQTRYAMVTKPIADQVGQNPATPLCLYEVDLFDKNGKSLSEKAFVNTCVEDTQGQHGQDGRLKIVTFEQYQKLFAVHLGGIYQRYDDNLLKQILPNTSNKKGCRDTDVQKITLNKGGGAKIEVPIYVLKIGAEATISRLTERSYKFGEGYYSFYSSYHFMTAHTKIYPIEAMSLCDTHLAFAKTPYSLTIYHEDLPNKEFSFNIEALIKSYQQIDEDMKGYQTTKHEYYQTGRFWVIRGADQYFKLRDVLRGNVESLPNINMILRDQEDPIERERVVNFFAHLVMEATSHFQPQKP